MIISAASDYRAAAQRILPPVSCSTIWMGVHILNTRCAATWKIWSEVALRQRILKNMSDLSLGKRRCLMRNCRCRGR
ncbi:L-lactate dehydrogenase [Escherichia coli]|nr:L-lactate dehydrogenase [Escherichia coli]